jgi:tRNA1Val (adenine37-N6)-methyltransferase
MSFRFKQFTIEQDHCAMKIGTDGVLLGASIPLDAIHNGLCAKPKILDIGTGTGLLALMIAQRLTAINSANYQIDFEIDAIEIEPEAAKQAAENVANSLWATHINVVHSAIQTFENTTQYDIIISNPPYFNRSLATKTTARQTARHTDSLSYDDFLTAVQRFLLPKGKLCLILPYPESALFLAKASLFNLKCSHKTIVFGRANKPPERCILVLAYISNENAHTQLIEKELIIYESAQAYTVAYCALTQNFYLDK